MIKLTIGIIIGWFTSLLVFASILDKYEKQRESEIEEIREQLRNAITNYTAWSKSAIEMWLKLNNENEGIEQ